MMKQKLVIFSLIEAITSLAYTANESALVCLCDTSNHQNINEGATTA